MVQLSTDRQSLGPVLLAIVLPLLCSLLLTYTCPQVSKSHLRIVNSAETGVRLCDLGSKHGAVITKPAPDNCNSDAPPATMAAKRTQRHGEGQAGAGRRPAGLGGKDPPTKGSKKSPPPPPPPLPPKQKFFPIPIPREPEWVAGAHGDRISLGKTVLVLERKGGPEPSGLTEGRQLVGAAGTVASRSPRRRPAVISKQFAVNPNLVRGGCVHVLLYLCKAFYCS